MVAAATRTGRLRSEVQMSDVDFELRIANYGVRERLALAARIPDCGVPRFPASLIDSLVSTKLICCLHRLN